MAEHYDALVLGAGQAGGPLATALAKAGRKTAIVEREHVGGTCINEGCTPTKTMVASARVAYLAGRAGDYGVRTSAPTVDLARVRQRKRDIVEEFRGGSERGLTSTPGLDLLMGEARFTGPHTVDVRLRDGTTRHLEAPLIFINTGARPSRLPIDGIDSVPVLNSTTIMELDTVPEHLLVVGASYVALEFGQMFRRFGSRVTVVQRGPRFLPQEDADVADEVAKILREDGVDILLDCPPQRVAPGPDGGIRLTAGAPGAEQTLSGSHLLAAAGRTPNTDHLDLPAAGVQADKHGAIPVNERLETNVPGIYALGDVNGGPAFTHISYDDYRIIRANLLEGGHRTTQDRLVPYTMFIDPQLGRVGMTEQDAQKAGRAVRVARMPMSSVARALEVAEPRGILKALVDRDTDQILGAAAFGIEGGEIMAMFEIAMWGQLPYTVLRDGVFAHPTLAEALNNLFGSLR